MTLNRPAAAPPTRQRRLRRAALWAALLLSGAVAAQTPPATGTKPPPKPSAKAAAAGAGLEAQIEEARRLLREGQAAAAMTLARQAAQRAPADYRPPYYLALSLLMLGEPGAAGEAQARSAALAQTDAARSAVAALAERIAGQQRLAEADAALADGRFAKAAELYGQAWRAEALPAARQLAYAELLLDRQNDLAGAAAVLRELARRQLGTPEAETAVQRLQALAPRLKQAAAQHLATARQAAAGAPARLDHARRALALDADLEVAAVLVANELAAGGDWAQLQPALLALHRRQWLQPALERRWIPLDGWQQHAELQALFADIWGADQGRALLRAGAGGGYDQQEAARLQQARAAAEAAYRAAAARYEARQAEILQVKRARETCLRELQLQEFGTVNANQPFYRCKRQVDRDQHGTCMERYIGPLRSRCEAARPLPAALPLPSPPPA